MLLTKFRSPVWWHSYQRILANLLRLKISLNNGQSKHTWSSLHSMCSCRYYLSNISNISINKFNRWSAGCNRIWTHFLFVILYLILQSLVGRFIKRSKENSHFWTLWNPNVHGLAAAQEAVGIAIPPTDARNRWSNGESRFDEISLCFLLAFFGTCQCFVRSESPNLHRYHFCLFCCACAGLVHIVVWFLFWFGACQCFCTSHNNIRMIIWWKKMRFTRFSDPPNA